MDSFVATRTKIQPTIIAVHCSRSFFAIAKRWRGEYLFCLYIFQQFICFYGAPLVANGAGEPASRTAFRFARARVVFIERVEAREHLRQSVRTKREGNGW